MTECSGRTWPNPTQNQLSMLVSAVGESIHVYCVPTLSLAFKKALQGKKSTGAACGLTEIDTENTKLHGPRHWQSTSGANVAEGVEREGRADCSPTRIPILVSAANFMTCLSDAQYCELYWCSLPP